MFQGVQQLVVYVVWEPTPPPVLRGCPDSHKHQGTSPASRHALPTLVASGPASALPSRVGKPPPVLLVTIGVELVVECTAVGVVHWRQLGLELVLVLVLEPS